MPRTKPSAVSDPIERDRLACPDPTPDNLLRLQQARQALFLLFSRRAHLQWYCKQVGANRLTPESAVEDFFRRAEFLDVSPTPLFDPVWFRGQYHVTGINSFLSYLLDERQRFARPSPLFLARWYARAHGIASSLVHPFLHYLSAAEEHDPHPLIDTAYLARQDTSQRPGTVALEFLIDSDKHRLRPHPLFDSGWYLDTNSDVASARINPLQHYLYFGTHERRQPNRYFNVGWYRSRFIDDYRHQQAARLEPLTHYVTLGFARGFPPGPGLLALTKSTAPLTPHGPKLYVDCVERDRNLYAAIVHRPKILPSEFNTHMQGSIERYNSSFAENMVLLRRPRVALMFTGKCASGKILYWWLEQAHLLESALRWTSWSHEFEESFRLSREFITDALTFDPARYRIYKFVRNPLLRAVSTFTHLLTFPASFGLTPNPKKRSFSFVEYLDLLDSTDLMVRDGHCQPQLSRAETSGLVAPVVLKIEDGLDEQFAAIERRHGLPPARFEQDPEIRATLRIHAKQPDAGVKAEPHDQVPFGRIPKARPLLTPETIERLYALYRSDFEAYGYRPAV